MAPLSRSLGSLHSHRAAAARTTNAGVCGESRAEPGTQPDSSRAARTRLVIKLERTDRKLRSWTRPGCDEVCSAQFPFSFTETPSPNPAGVLANGDTGQASIEPLAAVTTPLQIKVPSKERRQTQLSPVPGWREGKSGGLTLSALGATLPPPQFPAESRDC